jgi:energy-coupling factor transporter ATP-binding protein EcfA2
LLVEARDLRYSWEPGDPSVAPAVDGVSFSLARGECLGVIGGPGAGKSTLAALLAGLLVPQGGRLTVGGVLHRQGREARRRVAGRVAYAPQWPERQLFAATVGEDVAAGLGKSVPGASDPRVGAALRAVGIDPEALLHRPVLSLSGGEARRVALAGILVLDRPVVVLDEPAAGLDGPSRRMVASLIAGLRGAGRGVVVISHHLEDLLPAADRLLVMEGGKALFHGRPEEAAASRNPLGEAAMEWPPLVELMRRLGARWPGLPAVVTDPREAAGLILGRIRGASR